MDDDTRARTRRHVLEIAAGILERDGAAAVSTRSVAAAAGIRAASLYGLFGDKDGLLSALAVHAFDEYLTEKRTLARTDDPIADLRRGWDAHVAFGVRHPALYLLMHGTDRPGRRPPAAEQAHDDLLAFLDHAARTGHLRVPPALAARILYAGVVGVTLTLVGEAGGAQDDGDPQLSATMREALVDALTVPAAAPAPEAGVAALALTLDAALTAGDAEGPLRPAETALLHDWLHRLAVPSGRRTGLTR